MKTTHKLPDGLTSEGNLNTILGRNLISVLTARGKGLRFLRLPSVTSQKPVEWWSTPPHSFNVGKFDVYPPDDILAIAEAKTQ